MPQWLPAQFRIQERGDVRYPRVDMMEAAIAAASGVEVACLGGCRGLDNRARGFG